MNLIRSSRKWTPKIDLLKWWLIVLTCAGLIGCATNPVTRTIFHPIKAVESIFSHPASTPVPSPSQVGTGTAAATGTPANSNVGQYSLPSTPANLSFASILPAISSGSAPAILVSGHRWFYLACLVSALAGVLAFYTGHMLAGIKFEFAAVLGAAVNWLFGLVIASYVLSTLVAFALGLVIAWYILNHKHGLELKPVTQSLNDRLSQLEQLVVPKVNPPKT